MRKSLGDWLTARLALIGDFCASTRANTAIIFALSSLPIIAAVGCVVDYSYASMVKTKLQAAAWANIQAWDAVGLNLMGKYSCRIDLGKSLTFIRLQSKKWFPIDHL